MEIENNESRVNPSKYRDIRYANKNISISLNLNKNLQLNSILFLPSNAKGLVIFAHGSGSSRLSPRNQYVANAFNQAGYATLLFDLLTAEEDSIDQATTEYRFNIPLLADRLIMVTQWVRKQEPLKDLKLALFGASTGAAAALIATAKLDDEISLVISRGGRADLAGKFLPQITCPVLLIVGSLDPIVIELNELAKSQIQSPCELKLIPNATHLFEEPGTLDKVIELAIEWLEKCLS